MRRGQEKRWRDIYQEPGTRVAQLKVLVVELETVNRLTASTVRVSEIAALPGTLGTNENQAKTH